MKKLTSFMKLNTGEGDRIAYTYSELSEDGKKVVSSNIKDGFLIVDESVAAAVKVIEDYIKEEMEG